MAALQERDLAGPCVPRSEQAANLWRTNIVQEGSQFMTEQTVETVSARKTYPGMAHFAGTGPVGKTCRLCRFWENDTASRWAMGGTLKNAACAKYRHLMGGQKGKTFPHDAAACKYFEERGRAPEPVINPPVAAE